MLSDKYLISIYDAKHNLLQNSLERRGQSVLLYSLNPMHFATSTSAQSDIRLVHNSAYNKRNYTKGNITKGNRLPKRQNIPGTIEEVIKQSKYQSLFRF